MITVQERYEMQAAEGHVCLTDVAITLGRGRTAVQESFSVAGLQTLDEAAACCVLYLAGYAAALDQAIAQGLYSVRRIRILSEDGQAAADVELSLQAPLLRRSVMVRLDGCSGLGDARTGAAAVLGAMAEELAAWVRERRAGALARADAFAGRVQLDELMSAGASTIPR